VKKWRVKRREGEKVREILKAFRAETCETFDPNGKNSRAFSRRTGTK